ncbi:hypothetical protein FM037_05045 [Shewanella psychropiezotolerans]|uniref:Lipoxygenase n=2 Tax=Shewanellaceae TaxID=267890 RepID=A0ABX5WUF2_9GAMM|nr:hypothetical protein [Shewanella sp. YLB-07]QDO82718.1 hypothetical protein FM037_05045 [Shewanella psychropiezotolerans]
MEEERKMTDKTEQPTVQVKGIVNAAIEDVWKLYRPFGEMTQWWHIYKTMELAPPAKDEIGAIRTFSFKNRNMTISEQLISRDDKTHTLQYKLVKMEPAMPGLDSITTQVQMRSISAVQTEIIWCNWVMAPDVVSSIIKGPQAQGYHDGIAALNQYFNPSLGKVTVTLGSIKDLPQTFPPVNPYVIVELDGEHHQTAKPNFPYSSTFNDTFEFELLSKKGSLGFGVMDSCLGSDTLIGTASLDLHDFENDKPKTLELELDEGASVSVTIEMELNNDADALPLTDKQQQFVSLKEMSDTINGIKDKLQKIVLNLLVEEKPRWEYDSYPVHPMPKMVKGLPRSQALSPHKLSRMAERVLEFSFSELELKQRLAQYPSGSLKAYGAFFGGYLPIPELLESWQDDSEFCRQLLQGLNPLMIEVVNSIEQVPEAMRELKAQDKGMSELIADKRLFLVDYKELVPFKCEDGKYFYAPYLLVYKQQLENNDSRLNIVAIQLERNEGINPIYTPDSNQPNRFMFAKIHTQCADNQIHQFLYHLGLAHLAIEAMAIATHNSLPKEHIVSKLLTPHFHDTIGINFLARQTLVAEQGAITQSTFALGTAQGVQMVSNGWKSYDFFKSSFPEQLKARGFDEEMSDGLQGYYYREDGFLIWNAIGNYTSNVVKSAYSDDAAVQADPALQAWAKELADPELGAMPGFPAEITDLALLSHTLQTIIWMGSAFHSAINFPQFPYTALAPNRPATLAKQMPEGEQDISAEYIAAALPNQKNSAFQCLLSWMLAMPSETSLASLDPLQKDHPEISQAFTAEMIQISEKIQARNKQLAAADKPEYGYLLPENIAASIDI